MISCRIRLIGCSSGSGYACSLSVPIGVNGSRIFDNIQNGTRAVRIEWRCHVRGWSIAMLVIIVLVTAVSVITFIVMFGTFVFCKLCCEIQPPARSTNRSNNHDIHIPDQNPPQPTHVGGTTVQDSAVSAPEAANQASSSSKARYSSSQVSHPSKPSAPPQPTGQEFTERAPPSYDEAIHLRNARNDSKY